MAGNEERKKRATAFNPKSGLPVQPGPVMRVRHCTGPAAEPGANRWTE